MNAILEMFAKARRAVIRRGAAIDDADDIVQEAFARMQSYLRAHAVENKEAFLMRVAVNISRDQARRNKSAPFAPADVAADVIADDAPQPDEIIRAQERLRRARAGLARLDEETRRWLLAQRLEGVTFAQIAAREGVPATTVEKRVARAIVFLVKWMDGW